MLCVSNGARSEVDVLDDFGHESVLGRSLATLATWTTLTAWATLAAWSTLAATLSSLLRVWEGLEGVPAVPLVGDGGEAKLGDEGVESAHHDVILDGFLDSLGLENIASAVAIVVGNVASRVVSK